MPTYKEKLSDRRWQIKKSKILERDEYKCQSHNCESGENSQLQVHHLTYLGNLSPWDYPDDMLITLCKMCHELESGRSELEKHLSNTLKMKGFLFSDLLAMSSKIDKDEKFAKTLLSILRKFQNG
jgi:5-methylcytosine-specific restriction endonuclease McrA